MLTRTASLTLKSLVEAIRSGDSKAQGLLYQFAKQTIYPNIQKYLGSRGQKDEDIHDLFQDAFIVLLDKIREGKFSFNALTLRSHGNQLGAYLMTIVQNLWKKEMRRRNRVAPKIEDKTEEHLVFDAFSNVILDAFQALSENCQNLLSLYFKDKLSPRVIGGQLKKSTDEIKKELNKCTDRLLQDVGHFVNADGQGQLLALMQNSLSDLEERCQQILRLFYFEKTTMTQLAKELGYANAHSITEQKRRCMLRLNKAVVARLLNENRT